MKKMTSPIACAPRSCGSCETVTHRIVVAALTIAIVIVVLVLIERFV